MLQLFVCSLARLLRYDPSKELLWNRIEMHNLSPRTGVNRSLTCDLSLEINGYASIFIIVRGDLIVSIRYYSNLCLCYNSSSVP